MKTQPCEFFNIKQMERFYGIKIFHKGRWLYAGDNNGLLLFKNKEERDTKMKEIKKMSDIDFDIVEKQQKQIGKYRNALRRIEKWADEFPEKNLKEKIEVLKNIAREALNDS